MKKSLISKRVVALILMCSMLMGIAGCSSDKNDKKDREEQEETEITTEEVVETSEETTTTVDPKTTEETTLETTAETSAAVTLDRFTVNHSTDGIVQMDYTILLNDEIVWCRMPSFEFGTDSANDANSTIATLYMAFEDDDSNNRYYIGSDWGYARYNGIFSVVLRITCDYDQVYYYTWNFVEATGEYATVDDLFAAAGLGDGFNSSIVLAGINNKINEMYTDDAGAPFIVNGAPNEANTFYSYFDEYMNVQYLGLVEAAGNPDDAGISYAIDNNGELIITAPIFAFAGAGEYECIFDTTGANVDTIFDGE